MSMTSDWFVVRLPADNLDMLAFITKIGEASAWCAGQFGEWSDDDARWDVHGDDFYFREKADAALFRLRWG